MKQQQKPIRQKTGQASWRFQQLPERGGGQGYWNLEGHRRERVPTVHSAAAWAGPLGVGTLTLAKLGSVDLAQKRISRLQGLGKQSWSFLDILLWSSAWEREREVLRKGLMLQTIAMASSRSKSWNVRQIQVWVWAFEGKSQLSLSLPLSLPLYLCVSLSLSSIVRYRTVVVCSNYL